MPSLRQTSSPNEPSFAWNTNVPWKSTKWSGLELGVGPDVLLERNPSEGLAFRKLLDYVGKGKGLEQLIKEYAGRVEKKPDAALLGLPGRTQIVGRRMARPSMKPRRV